MVEKVSQKCGTFFLIFAFVLPFSLRVRHITQSEMSIPFLLYVFNLLIYSTLFQKTKWEKMWYLTEILEVCEKNMRKKWQGVKINMYIFVAIFMEDGKNANRWIFRSILPLVFHCHFDVNQPEKLTVYMDANRWLCNDLIFWDLKNLVNRDVYKINIAKHLID